MDPIETFFAQAQAALALDPSLTYDSADAFGDTPAMADALAALVLAGQKTATTSAFALYAKDQEPLPQPRGLNIVLDGHEQPVALTYTEAVTIHPFTAITPEIAAKEGEGDLSLDYWRQVHTAFFTREFQAAGLTFDPVTALVVVEEFRLVFPIAQ